MQGVSPNQCRVNSTKWHKFDQRLRNSRSSIENKWIIEKPRNIIIRREDFGGGGTANPLLVFYQYFSSKYPSFEIFPYMGLFQPIDPIFGIITANGVFSTQKPEIWDFHPPRGHFPPKHPTLGISALNRISLTYAPLFGGGFSLNGAIFDLNTTFRNFCSKWDILNLYTPFLGIFFPIEVYST